MKLPNKARLLHHLGLLSVATLSCFAVPIWAADFEVSGGGGAHTMDGGVGTHGTFTGVGGIHFGGGFLFGEGGWTQLASTTVDSGSGITATGAVNLANFGGGVDYSIGASRRVVPYIVSAVGVGHFYAKGSASGDGTSASVSFSVANDVYYGIGGGARVYLGKHWGIKPEFRYQRYNGTLLQANSFISTVSFFWRSGGN